MPLSTIFQFYWWRKQQYPDKTTDLSIVTDKLSVVLVGMCYLPPFHKHFLINHCWNVVYFISFNENVDVISQKGHCYTSYVQMEVKGVQSKVPVDETPYLLVGTMMIYLYSKYIDGKM